MLEMTSLDPTPWLGEWRPVDAGLRLNKEGDDDSTDDDTDEEEDGDVLEDLEVDDVEGAGALSVDTCPPHGG